MTNEKLTRYITPTGCGIEIAPHGSGLLYRRDEVDPLIDTLRAENERLREALRPFAQTLERQLSSGITLVALNDDEDGRRLNVMHVESFLNARDALRSTSPPPAPEAPDLETAPVGTLAPAFNGGAWLKVESGWQWNGHTRNPGSTFPRPSGDWTGKLVAPGAPDEAVRDRVARAIAESRGHDVDKLWSAKPFHPMGFTRREFKNDADAALAALSPTPRPGAVQERVEFIENGMLDEVVTDGGAHLERMSKNGWFLDCRRVDGSSLAIWIEGRVTMVEERPRPGADGEGA